jgi:hypothetical protein
MSRDEDKTRAPTDPALKAVPRELRPFAERPENPVLRAGEDARLDEAVADLKSLGEGDPLFYDVRRVEAGDEERGAGNAKVYVPPVALSGKAAEEKRRRRVAAVALGVAVVGIAVAGANARRPKEQAEHAAARLPRVGAPAMAAQEKAPAVSDVVASEPAARPANAAARAEDTRAPRSSSSTPPTRRRSSESTAPKTTAIPAAPTRTPAPSIPAAPPSPAPSDETSGRMFGDES